MAISEIDVIRKNSVQHQQMFEQYTCNITNVGFCDEDNQILFVRDIIRHQRSFVITNHGIIVVDENENILIGYSNTVKTVANSLRFTQRGSINDQGLVDKLNKILSKQPIDEISAKRMQNLKKQA